MKRAGPVSPPQKDSVRLGKKSQTPLARCVPIRSGMRESWLPDPYLPFVVRGWSIRSRADSPDRKGSRKRFMESLLTLVGGTGRVESPKAPEKQVGSLAAAM